MRHLSIPALLVLLALPALPASAQLAVPNADGITYGHVHLNVSDIELHKRLWVEHFGGVVVQKGSLTAVRFPNFLIALSEKTPTGGSQGSVMNHFGFKVRSTPDFLEKWKATGLEAADVFIGAEGHRNSYVMMPDGVWVELQEDQALPVEVSGVPHPLQHPRLRSPAGLVRRRVLAGKASTGTHHDDGECAGDEHELR